ncbi:hypothetical protein [Rhizobium giardinii]
MAFIENHWQPMSYTGEANAPLGAFRIEDKVWWEVLHGSRY